VAPEPHDLAGLPGLPTDPDDEFALLHENAAELGLPWREPTVDRVEAELPDGRRIRAIRWGDGEPEVVLVHGGAQNAHTWDSVAYALDRPLLAVDLPGHGRSDRRPDRRYLPDTMAADLAAALPRLAPSARAVVGMSLGGLTSLALTGIAPELVAHLVLVDITPGVTGAKAASVAAFVAGPESFATFEEMLARTVAHHPHRSVTSLRRGVWHNAHRRDDGRWVWRYDRLDGSPVLDPGGLERLWDRLGRHDAPLWLVRGGRSPVVTDDDVRELHRRRPDARIEVIPDAGHSVQGDAPAALAAILAELW